MAKRKILAKDIRISVSEDDLIYTEIGCAEEGEITTETVFAEANCQEDNGLTTKEPAEQNFNASLSGVVGFDGVNETPQDLAFNKDLRWFKWSTGIAGDRRVRALGYFTNYQETKGTADFGKYDLSFVNAEKAIFDKEEAVMVCTLTNGDFINISLTSTLTVAPRWLAVDDQGNTESGTTSTSNISISLSTTANWTVYVYIDDPSKISRFSLESTQELFIDFTDYRLYQASFAIEEAFSFQGVVFSPSDKEIEFISVDQTATTKLDLSVIPNITRLLKFFQADNFEEIIFPSSGGGALKDGFLFTGNSQLTNPIIDLRGYKFIGKEIVLSDGNFKEILFNTNPDNFLDLEFRRLPNYDDGNGVFDVSDIPLLRQCIIQTMPLITGFKGHESVYNDLVRFEFQDLQGWNQQVLDLSNYTNIGEIETLSTQKIFRVTNIPNLQSIIFASNVYTVNLDEVEIRECTSLGYIDLTSFDNVLDDGGLFDISNNGWSAAIVNQILVDLDSLPSTTTGTIDIRGNTAPDATSGGFDGTAAVLSLQGKGVTVTTD